jgi:hypothetical protein
MLKQIFDWFKAQLTLAHEVTQLRQENNELKRKLESQTELLRTALFMFESERQSWRHEHEKLLLRLENELLKFERRLPPPRSSDDGPRLKD